MVALEERSRGDHEDTSYEYCAKCHSNPSGREVVEMFQFGPEWWTDWLTLPVTDSLLIKGLMYIMLRSLVLIQI